VRLDHVIRHGPGATMNDQNGISRQELSLESFAVRSARSQNAT
jgi:hypothetical protein